MSLVHDVPSCAAERRCALSRAEERPDDVEEHVMSPPPITRPRRAFADPLRERRDQGSGRQPLSGVSLSEIELMQ
ncbi:hypothetical protein ACPXCF_00325 [Streptomyces sp. DT171]